MRKNGPAVAGYLYSRLGKSQSVIGFSGSGELLVENMGAIKVDAESLFLQKENVGMGSAESPRQAAKRTSKPKKVRGK